MKFQEPLHWLVGTDVVIVDPPRKGLHPSLVDALQKVSLSNKKVASKLERCEFFFIWYMSKFANI